MSRKRSLSRQRVRDDFDGAWKNMLSEKRFAAFAAFFMPDIFDEIDFARGVEFLEQELRAITRKTRRGHGSVDRLVKVWLKDGSERWVLVHVEIQSQVDAGFPQPLELRYHRQLAAFEEERGMAHLSTAERIGQRIGREEGRAEGKLEGRREVLLEQVTAKFGPLSENVAEVIHGLTESQLDRLTKEILTANTLNDLALGI